MIRWPLVMPLVDSPGGAFYPDFESPAAEDM